MAVAAWASGSTALATALYPVLAASLFAFLVGLVLVVAMRTSLRVGLAAAAVAVLPFGLADLALSVVAADPRAGGLGLPALLAHPAARQPEVLAYLVLGVALLVASATVADAASTVLRRVREELTGGEPAPGAGRRAAVREREAGLRLAEWELARAAEHRRALALALVGVDTPAGGDEAGQRLELMEGLDALVLDTVSRFDVVAAYGPRERLVVLPEKSAGGLREDAAQLCALAGERLGLEVRMALVSPGRGRALRELLTELEVDLARCRASGAAVEVGEVGAG